MSYRFFNHTSDLGVEIEGNTLNELYANAAQALVDMMIEGKDNLSVEKEKVIKLSSDSQEELFMDWLREIIFNLTVNGFVPLEVKSIKIEETQMKAVLKGGFLDNKKTRVVKEIKTPTYHMFNIKKNKKWYARVIFDV